MMNATNSSQLNHLKSPTSIIVRQFSPIKMADAILNPIVVENSNRSVTVSNIGDTEKITLIS